MKETEAMGTMADIEEQIAQLEISSRGWFETDEAFEKRCQTGRQQFKKVTASRANKDKKGGAGERAGGGGGGKYVAKQSTSWVTPGNTTKNFSSVPGGRGNSGGGMSGGKGGGIFAAMMNDSDSDSDSD